MNIEDILSYNNIVICVILICFISFFSYFYKKETFKEHLDKSTTKHNPVNNKLDETTSSTKPSSEFAETKLMDPMYKNLENSLKIVYDYPTVYVEEHPKSKWHIPYFGPQTRSNDDIPQFLEFSAKVIKDYPQTRLVKCDNLVSLRELDDNEEITHPVTLMLWRLDIKDINEQASAKNIE